MNNEKNKKWDKACHLGMVLVIVGYVSFSNHERVGDVVILTGTLIISVSKWVKLKDGRSGLNVGQSKTYS